MAKEVIVFEKVECPRSVRKALLVRYLRQKLAELKRGRPCLYLDRFDADLPLDLLLWCGYVLFSLAALYLGWPLHRVLALGGWLLLSNAAAVALHFLYLVWKDLVRERRNEFVKLSPREAMRGVVDFERWCD
ncbi:hypothetical protein Adeg_0741 [Ammonifex degensii KC4]|uniref:Uncharacterized protein n=1 Tax=Ammonifex degensii (strain DSM 10501 / KC4) TaxID=429009 RepID=C9RCB0_AMMDK|nr:hypothetical protein [Ammonifex degensii]ACX51887.1 hypothetical protein Adeg_0741 [Ammonifex degensii KC4]